MNLFESQREANSRLISHKIIDLLKSWDGHEFIGMIWHEIPIELFVQQNESNKTLINIIGETTNESISIIITCKYDHIPVVHLEQIHNKISSVVRHEIEHWHQLQDKQQESTYNTEKIFSGDPKTIEQYLLDSNEIEAYVSEIYFSAKKQHTTFNDIFKERIKPFIKSMIENNVSMNDIKQCMSNVKKSWFKYAAQRFPNVILQ